MSVEETIAAIVRLELDLLRVELRALREALEKRDTGAELLDSKALARLLGISRRALAARLRRGSDLLELAVLIDGRRAWRKADIDRLGGRARAPRLRSIGGGM